MAVKSLGAVGQCDAQHRVKSGHRDDGRQQVGPIIERHTLDEPDGYGYKGQAHKGIHDTGRYLGRQIFGLAHS
jgi:hypothetical protein